MSALQLEPSVCCHCGYNSNGQYWKYTLDNRGISHLDTNSPTCHWLSSSLLCTMSLTEACQLQSLFSNIPSFCQSRAHRSQPISWNWLLLNMRDLGLQQLCKRLLKIFSVKIMEVTKDSARWSLILFWGTTCVGVTYLGGELYSYYFPFSQGCQGVRSSESCRKESDFPSWNHEVICNWIVPWSSRLL